MPSTRRSTRSTTTTVKEPSMVSNQLYDHNDDDATYPDNTDEPTTTYELDGTVYKNYNDYVQAKRKRNFDKLHSLGLTQSSTTDFMSKRNKRDGSTTTASQRGLQSNKSSKSKASGGGPPPLPRRSSSRLSGSKTSLISLDYNVKYFDKDMSSIIRVQEEGGPGSSDDIQQPEKEEPERFFNDRINDGSTLSIEDAVHMNDPKWIKDHSVSTAKAMIDDIVALSSSSTINDMKETDLEASGSRASSTTKTKTSPTSKSRKKSKSTSPSSVMSLSNNINDTVDDDTIATMVDELEIDDETWVAKVTPDRIYSVATHPTTSKLIACAGDKQGYVGIWDVHGSTEVTSGQQDHENKEDNESKTNNNKSGQNDVSLFRVHARPICCLEWLTDHTMITASYDGSVRQLHAERGTFEEIFATFDSDSTYLEDLGYDLHQGGRYWTQSVIADPRYSDGSSPCLFVTTSVGDVFHVDLRVAGKEKITFHESLSEKKINSVSLHPNGTTLASGGLDGVVRLFDIRKFGDNRGNNSKRKSPEAFCKQHTNLSISSSFFSPSGNSLLTTSFANRLDIIDDAHLQRGTVKPTYAIRHNNNTGRWLTTFQAKWHPSLDVFCCGSMNQPRCIELFDRTGKLLRAVTGESLSSVMSRTCFHPTTKELIVIGGNSSGRVVALRKPL